jgi:tRNA (cmo5U34)-methyltransferase
MRSYSEKSTVQDIRERFDNDVERFSDISTGQVSTIDAAVTLELITEAAKMVNPNAKTLLDLGCGAGNYTLRMLGKMPSLKCTLLDLSKPMLTRALERIRQVTSNNVEAIQADIREAVLTTHSFDIILAGAVLHHLRDEQDWERVFRKLYDVLRPGGCLLICDMVTQSNAALTDYVFDMYGMYLENLKGIEYRRQVLDYIDKEDSPRSVIYQLDLMRKVGFGNVDILHKNLNFAAFIGIK